MEKFFSPQFLHFLNEHANSANLSIKSLGPFSEMTGISLTIDTDGKMLLCLSRSLDLATGLDASVQLVDSAVFDSSTRLLQFNLLQFKEKDKGLQRIRKIGGAVLSKPEYACEFVASFSLSSTDHQKFINSLSKALTDTPITSDESLRPRISVKQHNNPFPWPIKDEFSLLKPDRQELLDLFHWIGCTNFHSQESLMQQFIADDWGYQKIADLRFVCVEAPLLPFKLVSEALTTLISSSTRLVASFKECTGIPPPFELNKQRLKHFNERKFDHSTATADQSALIIFKSPLQTLSFKLNDSA